MTAGEAAKAAIALSVRVGNRLRSMAGKDGDVLDLRPLIAQTFTDADERAEAYRLLDLAAMVRRTKATGPKIYDLFAEGDDES